MARIGVDIDEPVFPWIELAHAACEAAGITNGQQVTRWAMHEDYGVTSDVLWSVLNEAYHNGMLLTGPPINDAVNQLQRLRNAGHTVHLATARGVEGPLATLIRHHTILWLDREHIPHDTLTFSADKTIVQTDWFIDDGVHNYDAVRPFTEVYLLNGPHNQFEDDRRRVDSLKEFVDIVLIAEETFG